MIINEKPQTEEEVAAQQAEARKSTAEGEFVIICEDKKRLLNESELLKNEINTLKSVIEKSKNEISLIKEKIINIQDTSLELQKETNTLIENKESFLNEFKQFENDVFIKKESLNSDILSLDNSYITKKSKLEKETNVLENKNISLKEDSNKILSNIEILKIQEVKQIKSNQEFIIINSNLIKSKDSLDVEIKTLKDIIESNKEILSTNKLDISNIAIEKISKENEIIELDKVIEIKKIEYKSIESKAFSLTTREDTLNQKEEYIKTQYERAGIKYE